jgi:UDP-glucose 4-epimerase
VDKKNLEIENHIILGGAGFIGSNLAQHLSRLSKKITIVDNFSLGSLKILEDLNLKNNLNIKVIDGDINSSTTWNHIYENNLEESFIWHLAANSDIKSGATNPYPDLINTFQTTASLIAHARELKLSGIAFASSSAVYGNKNHRLSEEMSCDPISNYGVAKLASENMLRAYSNLREIPLWIFRFANIVGTPATHGLLFDLFLKYKKNNHQVEILGNGSQLKTYLGVNELIKFMLKLIEQKNSGTWNLGPNDQGVSVEKIAKLFAEHLIPIPALQFGITTHGWPGDMPTALLNCDKLFGLFQETKLSSEVFIHHAIHDIGNQLEMILKCDRQ